MSITIILMSKLNTTPPGDEVPKNSNAQEGTSEGISNISDKVAETLAWEKVRNTEFLDEGFVTYSLYKETHDCVLDPKDCISVEEYKKLQITEPQGNYVWQCMASFREIGINELIPHSWCRVYGKIHTFFPNRDNSWKRYQMYACMGKK